MQESAPIFFFSPFPPRIGADRRRTWFNIFARGGCSLTNSTKQHKAMANHWDINSVDDSVAMSFLKSDDSAEGGEALLDEEGMCDLGMFDLSTEALRYEGGSGAEMVEGQETVDAVHDAVVAINNNDGAYPFVNSAAAAAGVVNVVYDASLPQVLVPLSAFTEGYVAYVFAIPAGKMRNFHRHKFTRMLELLKVFHHMHANGIAEFKLEGDVNVFGFTTVRVIDREQWNALMLVVADRIIRKRTDVSTEPIACIYEIFKYCGMEADRKHKNSRPTPNNQKKSLLSDVYVFNTNVFARNNHRVLGY